MSSNSANDPLRIVYLGTAELARASLSALCDSPLFQVAAVVTQPDRPKGRDLKLAPSPVKQTALERGLPVLQPERARSEAFLRQLQEVAPSLIVVAAYGQILPPSILELPFWGCLNVHASLLPKYRGAAPIQWVILDDAAETGVTIMKMDAGLDTGPMLTQASTPILPEDTGQTLHDRLARMGAELLVRTIPSYVAGTIQPQPQPASGATYARKIKKEDGLVDWTLPARVLWNRVRAFTPWPGAYTLLAESGRKRVLKIISAEVVPECNGAPGVILALDRAGIVIGCGQQALRIKSLQLEGGRKLDAQSFLAGHALRPGEMLG